MVQWLALCTFTLKGELKSYTLQGMAKNKKILPQITQRKYLFINI